MALLLIFNPNTFAQSKDAPACPGTEITDQKQIDELSKKACLAYDADYQKNSCAYQNWLKDKNRPKSENADDLNTIASNLATQMKIPADQKASVAAAIKTKLNNYSQSHCGGRPAQGYSVSAINPHVPACAISNTPGDMAKVWKDRVTTLAKKLQDCTSSYQNRQAYSDFRSCDQASKDAYILSNGKIQVVTDQYGSKYQASADLSALPMPADYLHDQSGFSVNRSYASGMDLENYLTKTCAPKGKVDPQLSAAAKDKLWKIVSDYNDSLETKLRGNTSFTDPPVYCPITSADQMDDWTDRVLPSSEQPQPCDVPIDKLFANNDWKFNGDTSALLKDSKASDSIDCLKQAKAAGLKIKKIVIQGSSSSLNNTGEAQKACCQKNFKCLSTKRAETVQKEILPKILGDYGYENDPAINAASCDITGSHGDGTSGPCAYQGTMVGDHFVESMNSHVPDAGKYPGHPEKNPAFSQARSAHAVIEFEQPATRTTERLQRKWRTTCYKLTVSCAKQDPKDPKKPANESAYSADDEAVQNKDRSIPSCSTLLDDQ